jgi:NADH:ubiquinone oxidoreductase subunit K
MITMMTYFVYVCFALFALGISGVAASRNFIVMMLSIEIAIVAATLLATVIFTAGGQAGIMQLLFALFTIAAAEVMTLIVFYRYLSRYELSMDVAKLSRLKDK